MKKIVQLGRIVGKKPGRRGANHLQRVQLRREKRKTWAQDFGRSLDLKKVVWTLLMVAILGCLGYGSWKGYRAYHDGRILTVNRIEVSGNHHWETSRLLEQAGLEVGSKMPGVSVRSARSELLQLPGIHEVSVHRSLDGGLRVEVQEEDVLALRHTDAWEGLTPSGAWMPLRAAENDVPVIDGAMTPQDAAALAVFLSGARAQYPQLFGSFSQINVRSQDEADIFWRDGRVRVRLDYTNKSLNSLEFLQALLVREKDSWNDGSTVDLRVEGYAYVL